MNGARFNPIILGIGAPSTHEIVRHLRFIRIYDFSPQPSELVSAYVFAALVVG